MPTAATALITSAGLAAAIAADGLGVELNITHVALGSAAYTPTSGQTALTNMREVAPVLVGSRAGSQLTITATFQASLYTGAQYDCGEIGFFAGDPNAGGTLFAVISSPSRASPRRGGSITNNYTQNFVISLSGVPSGSVNVTFDTNAAAALAALAAHAASGDPHAQYLLKAGGTLTGPLVLAGPGTLANHPITKTQFDSRSSYGTFTPELRFGGNSVGMTYAAQAGRFVKEGRMLLIDAYLVLSNKGSSTGLATIELTGLPHQFDATQAGLLGGDLLTGLTGQLSTILIDSTVTATVRQSTAGGTPATVNNTHFTNSSILHLTTTAFTDP
jgi:hypothetical protein